ncbi:TPA: hypothetical protein I9Z35_002846 [Clostridium perfringens]|nr:hypothetical protein [Clostridium perfringens]
MLLNHFKRVNEEILNLAYERVLLKTREAEAERMEHLRRKEKYLKRVANSKKLKGRKGKR